MKFGKIFHLGIVVKDLEKAVDIYENEMGYGPFEYGGDAFFRDKRINGKIGPGLPMRTAIYRGDGYEIELIEPKGPSTYMDFLEKNGPGIHHVILETKDSYEDVLAMAKRVSGRDPALRVEFPDGTPIVAYADMKEEAGILLEIGADQSGGEG